MPAATVSRGRFRRITTYRETALGAGNIAALRHIPAPRDTSYQLMQEQYEDVSDRNERDEQLAPAKGAKSWTAGFKTPSHKEAVKTLGDYFESALGGVRGSTPIAGAGGFTVSGFTFTGGTPHNWVIVEYASGRKIHMPIARIVPGAPSSAEYAYQLPTAVGITGVKNPNDFGAVANVGACYFEDPAGGYLSFSAEIDRAGEPNQHGYLMTGAIPRSLIWSLGFGDRRLYEVALEGRHWQRQGAPGNVAKPARPVKHAAPWQSHAYLLDDFDAPGAGPQRTRLVSYKINLAPAWDPVDGTQDRLGADELQLPTHATVEWSRGTPLGDGTIEIVTMKAEQRFVDDYEAGKLYHISLIDYLGDPGLASYDGAAACLYLPCAYQKEPPQEVVNGSGVGHRLLFHCRQERPSGNTAGNMSAGLLTKAAPAFFVP